MDNLSNPDENYDLGYQPSPSSLDQNDQSTTETPGYSTMSGDSFVYCRTNSETSAFCETISDQSCSGEASPSCWPDLKSGVHNQAVLTRLGMKQHKNVIADDKSDDQEALDAGWFFYIYLVFVLEIHFLDHHCKPIVSLGSNKNLNWLFWVLSIHGRAWANEGKVFETFAWGRHVWQWERSLHGSYNFKCNNQPLW